MKNIMEHITTSLILVIALSAFTLGCSTTKVSIRTNPDDVKVFARTIGGGALKQIGQTPLNVTSEDLSQHFNGSGAIYVELRKNGYRTDSFFVTEVAKMDLNINRQMTPIKDFERQQWLNGHIENVFEVRRLVEAKRYTDGLKLVQSLKHETPYVATLHELEGGIYMLKRDYRSALDAYRQARKYNPQNREATKLVRYLERYLGEPAEMDFVQAVETGRLPASEDLSENKTNEDTAKDTNDTKDTVETSKEDTSATESQEAEDEKSVEKQEDSE